MADGHSAQGICIFKPLQMPFRGTISIRDSVRLESMQAAFRTPLWYVMNITCLHGHCRTFAAARSVASHRLTRRCSLTPPESRQPTFGQHCTQRKRLHRRQARLNCRSSLLNEAWGTHVNAQVSGSWQELDQQHLPGSIAKTMNHYFRSWQQISSQPAYSHMQPFCIS